MMMSSKRVRSTASCVAWSEQPKYSRRNPWAIVRQIYSQMCTSDSVSVLTVADGARTRDIGWGKDHCNLANGKPDPMRKSARIRLCRHAWDSGDYTRYERTATVHKGCVLGRQ